MFDDLYKNKKVFITGHTGFKGGWLTIWLEKLGANVCGYSLEPNTNPSIFDSLEINKRCESVIGDILDFQYLKKTMSNFQPDIVFHLAAQPLVRFSYIEPKLTYETNVIGSLNVLESARKCTSIQALVNVTTDKCYENKEVARGYKEDEPMGGYDMYSSSKACVEIMSSSFRRSFLQDSGYAMATARAGNVIGGGDFALDRLVPDCVRYINDDKEIEIRNPLAIRPWQFVLEPLSGYLLLGQKLLKYGKDYAQSFNFGPTKDSVLKVAEVAQKVCECYGKGEVIIHKKYDLHEANLLMLNIDKAKKVLGWIPTYVANETISKTIEWYKHFYQKDLDMFELTMKQIREFERRVKWVK